MDICPTYNPSDAMLWGEPYILEYQSHIDYDIQAVAKQTQRVAVRRVVIPDSMTWQMSVFDVLNIKCTESIWSPAVDTRHNKQVHIAFPRTLYNPSSSPS